MTYKRLFFFTVIALIIALFGPIFISPSSDVRSKMIEKRDVRQTARINRDVLDNGKEYPGTTVMAQNSVTGEDRAAIYYDRHVWGITVDRTIERASSMPLHIADTFWSIVAARAGDEMQPTIKYFRIAFFFLVFIFICFCVFLTYDQIRKWVMARDQREHRDLEEALRESEKKFRALTETVEMSIFIIQGEKYRYVNPSFLSMTGYTEQDIAEMNYWDFIHPDYRDLVRRRGLARQKGEPVPPHYELKFIAKTGEERWADFYATFIEHEKKPAMLGVAIDTTERKKGEDALRHSEATHRALIEMTNTGFVVVDSEGRVIDANDEYVSMTGYRVLADIIGRRVLEWTAEYEKEKNAAAVAKCFREGLIRNLEIDYSDARGKVTPVEINATVVEIEGTPRIMTICRNIAERRRAEQVLRSSEEKYRNIFENSIEGIFQSTPEGRFVSVNPSLSRIAGYDTPEEMIEKITSIENQFYVDPGYRLEYKKLLDSNDVVNGFESNVYRKDGSEIWISEKTRAVKNAEGQVLYYEGMVEDITKQKEIEEELRRSEAIYRTVFDNTGTCMIMMNEDKVITLCNQEWLKLSGFSREEVEGKKKWTEFIHEEDLKRMEGYYEQRRMDPQDVPQQYEFRAVDRYGKIRHMINTMAFIPGTGMTVAAQLDITELKNLESQLIQAQKLEAIGTLAGGIAHDFNNLLMAIQGYVSLMLINIDSSHPHYDKLRAVEERVVTGANLTGQLLGFARGGRYEVKAVDLNKVLENTSAMFGQTKKEITIHKNLQEGIWAVEADTSQLEQVFLNIYVNAWQAMPGGGHLYLETDNITVTGADTKAYHIKPGRYVRIAITDTGTGMDEKTKKRIFEPFFTTREMGRGTGLGLAMVYGIIKGHGGYINVYSEENKGTNFKIYLPATEKEVEKKEMAEQVAMRGRETILLIDDEATIVVVMTEILEALGYKVLSAGSGEEAVRIYDEKRDLIDLVILDMVMPGMGGGETFDRLKQANPGIKVILSSGYTPDGEAAGIIKRGCRGFIQKPINIHELSRKIREVL